MQKLLPRDKVAYVDLEGKLKLEFYKLEETFKGDITLNPSDEDATLTLFLKDSLGWSSLRFLDLEILNKKN